VVRPAAGGTAERIKGAAVGKACIDNYAAAAQAVSAARLVPKPDDRSVTSAALRELAVAPRTLTSDLSPTCSERPRQAPAWRVLPVFPLGSVCQFSLYLARLRAADLRRATYWLVCHCLGLSLEVAVFRAGVLAYSAHLNRSGGGSGLPHDSLRMRSNLS
jgi:hypothetical protein